MSASRDSNRWWLERVALGEIEPSAEALQSRGIDPAWLASELERMRANDAVVLEKHPPETMAAQILARAQPTAAANEPPPARGWIPAVAAVLLLGSVAAWWGTRGADESRPEIARADTPPPSGTPAETSAGPLPGPGTERIKGDTALSVTRNTRSAPEQLENDARAQAGDLLQLAYRAGTARTGVIVSIDGSGNSTLHFPNRVDASSALDTRGEVTLDHSFELDDAPEFERFFFVTTGQAPAVKPAIVLEAARVLAQQGRGREGALDVPSTWQQQSVRLLKR
jgi:hypothetical protein